MYQRNIAEKIETFNTRARIERERIKSPEVIQITQAVRHPGAKKIYAKIKTTLQRADPLEELEAIDYYTIELLNYPQVQEDVDAWVFGYSGDLLEAVPWFQINDIVEVVKYDHPDFPAREWWILETATRVEKTVGDEVKSSIAWNAQEHRAMAVFS